MSAKQFRGAEHPNAVLLCIEDDETLLDCLKSLLERHGYCVLAASSGRGGLEILTAHAVDLVVLDYAMPGMNGPQVASAIKRMCPQTRHRLAPSAPHLSSLSHQPIARQNLR